MSILARCLSLVLLFGPCVAGAFPEMIRHGYTQCTACHFSPSGGGLLTSYGRQLSGELMSRWSYPGEGLFLHGALGEAGMESGIHVGGDIRTAQIHRETAMERQGQLFLMQSQVELAYQKQNALIVLTIGEIERPMDKPFRGNFNAPQYYGQFQFNDYWSIRAGRFMPNFGLKLPDHTLVTRNYLGLLPYIKRDTVEANYLGENWTISMGSTRTTDSTPTSQQSHAMFATMAYSFAERYKVGLSHWKGEKSAKDHNMQSAFALLGWTHRFFSLLEFDRQELQHQVSTIGMTRLGYEVTRGIVPYLQIQILDPNTKNSNSRSYYQSVGMQIFPRPHFELNGQWTRVNTPQSSRDEAYLIFHYYL